MHNYCLNRVGQLSEVWPQMRSFLAVNEAVHNLLLGLLGDFVEHPEAVDDLAYAAVIRDPQQNLVMTALQTKGHNLILSQTRNPDVLDLLIDDLNSLGLVLPGVIGPQALSQQFAVAWAERTRSGFVLTAHERIHELTTIAIPPTSHGNVHQAGAGDEDWIVDWLGAFVREAMPHQVPNVVAIAARSAKKLYQPRRQAGFSWLETDGTPVCLVGYGNPTITGIRVGPVYTPPALRGHGYATELVRQVSQDLLGWGYRRIYLFTDLNNLTSNRIYRRIGYQPIADVDSYGFTSPHEDQVQHP